MLPKAPRRQSSITQINRAFGGALAARKSKAEELWVAEAYAVLKLAASCSRRLMVKDDVAAGDGLVHPVDAEKREHGIGEGGG